jgi:hypothetical protein
MGRRARPFIAVVVILVWVLSVPLMSALCHCIGMGVMCKNICAPSYAPVAAPPRAVAFKIVSLFSSERLSYVPTPVIKVPKPPPRLVLS